MSLDYNNKTNTRVTAYWLAYWRCTDTWVGLRVYFLDDIVLAVSHQSARKSDESFTFANNKVKKEFKEYIISLAEVDDEKESEEPKLDLKQDMGMGIPVHYASQLISKYVYYNDELCKVIYPKGMHKNGQEYTKSYSSNHNERINIELSNGSQAVVDLNDCVVTYNII